MKTKQLRYTIYRSVFSTNGGMKAKKKIPFKVQEKIRVMKIIFHVEICSGS